MCGSVLWLITFIRVFDNYRSQALVFKSTVMGKPISQLCVTLASKFVAHFISMKRKEKEKCILLGFHSSLQENEFPASYSS